MPKNERALPDGFLTVGKLAERMGVTVRTLQYYDREGPVSYTHLDVYKRQAQDTPPEQAEYEICRMLFLLLCEATGRRPAWGMLTGVRPVRLVHDMRRAGKAPEEIESFLSLIHI